MKKKNIIIIAVTTAVVLGTVAACMLVQKKNHFKIIKTDNKDEIISVVSNLEDSYFISDDDNKVVKLIENKEETELHFSDLGIIPKLSDNSHKEMEKFIVDESNIEVEYDIENLRSELEKLNDNRYDTEKMYITKHDNVIELVDELKGNKLDIDKLYEYIVDIIGTSELFVNLNDFYVECDNEEYNNKVKDEYNRYINTYIEYDNKFKIALSDYTEYVKVEDNKITINCDDYEHWYDDVKLKLIENISDYNTVGKPRKFASHSGKTVEVSGGTLGDIIDMEAETKYVFNELVKFSTEENRKPILIDDKDSKWKDEKTYIEVDASEQHVYVYIKGKLVTESDCVTGKADGRHNTPYGVWYVTHKAEKVYITPSGSKTASFVKVWMQFTPDGCGLHDASWRSKFGGDIYKNNGSHGCVNLPTDFALELYDLIDAGIPVIVYGDEEYKIEYTYNE